VERKNKTHWSSTVLTCATVTAATALGLSIGVGAPDTSPVSAPPAARAVVRVVAVAPVAKPHGTTAHVTAAHVTAAHVTAAHAAAAAQAPVARSRSLRVQPAALTCCLPNG
jgi:hypothetical protein